MQKLVDLKIKSNSPEKMATKLVNSLFAQTSTETFEEPAIPITKGVSSEAASVSKNLISAAVADALFSGASQTETSAAA